MNEFSFNYQHEPFSKKRTVRRVFVFFDRFFVSFRRESVIRETRGDRASRENRRDIRFLTDFVRNFDMFDKINNENEREFDFSSMRFRRFRRSLSTILEFFDNDDDSFDLDFAFDVKMKKKKSETKSKTKMKKKTKYQNDEFFDFSTNEK